MMKKYVPWTLKAFLSFGALISQVGGQVSAAEVGKKSQKALKVQESLGELTGRLDPGYHFNEKAPNQILLGHDVLTPKEIKPREIKFVWPKTKGNSGLAQLYVCDDPNTYCETHEIQLTETGAGSFKAQAKSPTKGIHRKAQPLTQILSRAQKEKKPILLDFSARWCPGCVRLENEIFPTPEFKELVRPYVFEKIDVDLFESFPISKKYKITAIPTLLVLDSRGRIVDRIVDYQALTVLTPFLKSHAKSPKPLDELRESRGSDLLALAKKYLAGDRPEKALRILSKIQPPPRELVLARVALAKKRYEESKSRPLKRAEVGQEESAKKDYVKSLKKALDSESESFQSLLWRTQLIDIMGKTTPEGKLTPEGQKWLEEGQALAETLLSDEGKLRTALASEDVGEFKGYEKMFVAVSLSELMETAGVSEEESLRRALEIGAEYKISAKSPGPARRYLLILMGAKKWDLAEKLIDEMLKEDPTNFDVRRRKIKLLMTLGRNEEALNLGQTLLGEAEGRAQFWIAESMAKAYLVLNRASEASGLLKGFLKRNELKLEAMAKTKSSFELLLAEAQQAEKKTTLNRSE